MSDKLREAAQLALKALKAADRGAVTAWTGFELMREASTALTTALAEQAEPQPSGLAALEACADMIRAGEDIDAAMRAFGVAWVPAAAPEPDDEDCPPPKIIDPLPEIWLNYGDIECDATHAECARNGEVTWCEDPVFESDVRYTLYTAPPAATAALSDAQIRSIFLAAGFTIKEGQTDLKPYVYEAARKLESTIRAQAVPAPPPAPQAEFYHLESFPLSSGGALSLSRQGKWSVLDSGVHRRYLGAFESDCVDSAIRAAIEQAAPPPADAQA